jgi:V-type H+-transporting ATPase subunit G
MSTSTASSGSSQQLIQKLLKAEEEAEQLIARARENRVRKLREAKQAADDELEIFKRKEEERFQAEVAQSNSKDDSRNIEQQIADELKQVEQDFVKNKDKIVEYMTAKILSVKPELTQIQIALLQAQQAAA